MLPTARKLAFTDVPVVDLSAAWSGDAGKRRALAAEIAEACGRVGFMYVRNHGIAAADIDAIFKTAADFHTLPLETKMESSMARNADAQGQGFLHGMTKGTGKNLAENLQEAFQFRRFAGHQRDGLLAVRGGQKFVPGGIENIVGQWCALDGAGQRQRADQRRHGG
jgi:isopenicillin N synthase-like dioxygenase